MKLDDMERRKLIDLYVTLTESQDSQPVGP